MTIRSIVLLCLLFNISAVKLAYSDENIPYVRNFFSNQNYSTVACINNILTKYFPCGTLTTFVNPNANADDLVKSTNKAEICHRIIVRTFENRDWFIWTNVYVITVEDVIGLWSGLLDLTRDLFWNPRAKFIIQVNHQVGEDKAIELFFKILLLCKIYSVVLLQVVKGDAVIYSYHPFENQGCGKRFDKVITLGTCETAQNITDYFPNRIPNVMQNCTFKVVATDDVPNFISKASNYTVYGKFVSGLEQYVLDTIAEREGFNIDYETFGVDVTYGVVLRNRTATGLLNYIDKGKADIAAGGYILMKNRVELFDYLWGFNYAAFYLYTPAVRNQIWQRVYREFGLQTWLLIAAAIFLVLFVGLILKTLLRDKSFSILNLWGYFFGNAGGGMSKHKKFRYITIWWAVFTFYISNFYNTALFSLITVHVHGKPQSLSVSNLKNLPYAPCISANSRLFFKYTYKQDLPKGEAIHNCTSTDNALKYVAEKQKHYAIELEYSYKLKEYQYISNLGKHELDSYAFSSTNVIVMYLERGFPFIDRFQDYAHRMYEAGLIKNHLQTINLRSYSVLQRYPKPFTMTTLLDLRMHFGILFGGYILSIVCFMIEIWYPYIKEERKFKRMVTMNRFKGRTESELWMPKKKLKTRSLLS